MKVKPSFRYALVCRRFRGKTISKSRRPMERFIRTTAILIFALVILNTSVSAQPAMRYDTDSSFVLEGNITGMDTGRVVLQYGNKNGAYVVDTTLVKNGRFRFKGTVDRIAYALLVGNLNTRLVEDPNNTSFFIEPGKL